MILQGNVPNNVGPHTTDEEWDEIEEAASEHIVGETWKMILDSVSWNEGGTEIVLPGAAENILESVIKGLISLLRDTASGNPA